MGKKLSVVIQTLNEEQNLERAIRSVRSWADEIVVCDMYSTDRTVSIAKNLGARVVYFKNVGFVEPARNFAISRAREEWVLILDADEEIPSGLTDKIKEILSKPGGLDFVEIPRKNIIFGKWMKASMWWPDYNVRLFKKNKVIWGRAIHSKPQTNGNGVKLPDQESFAVVHHNYQTVSQFLRRMDRYSDIQARELQKEGVIFRWKNLLDKPLGEFLSRYFDKKGYLDGIHGLGLSLLQALSFLIVYLKLWEFSKFRQEEIALPQVEQEFEKTVQEIKYWVNFSKLSKNPFKRFLQKATGKI